MHPANRVFVFCLKAHVVVRSRSRDDLGARWVFWREGVPGGGVITCHSGVVAVGGVVEVVGLVLGWGL